MKLILSLKQNKNNGQKMPLLSEKAGEKIISRYKNTSRNQ